MMRLNNLSINVSYNISPLIFQSNLLRNDSTNSDTELKSPITSLKFEKLKRFIIQ